MNNQKLLKMAAVAAGYEVSTNGTDFWLMKDGVDVQHWNPLQQDDHALRLAVDMGIKFRFHFVLNQALAWRNFQEFRVNAEDHNNDFQAATRLAIVKAAALVDGLKDEIENNLDMSKKITEACISSNQKLHAEIHLLKIMQPALLEALTSAKQFIQTGVEFGYIRMPDEDTPDAAHNTLPLLNKALDALSGVYDQNADQVMLEKVRGAIAWYRTIWMLDGNHSFNQQIALEILQAALGHTNITTSVQDGGDTVVAASDLKYVVLPTEPTPELFKAFYDGFNNSSGGYTRERFNDGYKAMIAQVQEAYHD